MGTVIVDNQMNLPPAGKTSVDLFEEPREFLVPVPWLAPSHPKRSVIEGPSKAAPYLSGTHSSNSRRLSSGEVLAS